MYVCRRNRLRAVEDLWMVLSTNTSFLGSKWWSDKLGRTDCWEPVRPNTARLLLLQSADAGSHIFIFTHLITPSHLFRWCLFNTALYWTERVWNSVWSHICHRLLCQRSSDNLLSYNPMVSPISREPCPYWPLGGESCAFELPRAWVQDVQIPRLGTDTDLACSLQPWLCLFEQGGNRTICCQLQHIGGVWQFWQAPACSSHMSSKPYPATTAERDAKRHRKPYIAHPPKKTKTKYGSILDLFPTEGGVGVSINLKLKIRPFCQVYKF